MGVVSRQSSVVLGSAHFQPAKKSRKGYEQATFLFFPFFELYPEPIPWYPVSQL